jgi:uncharacterized protein
MKQSLLLFTISVVLFIVVLTPTSAQFLNPSIASVKAVAVKSGPQPEGAVINITVIVTEGDGRVFVSTTPYTEIDMQGSAQLAAITASDLIGKDFTKYDFFYIIEADSPIVGGPSAGGVLTVATLSALLGLEVNKTVYMTGMIYPDGFIGPVGGIPYKLEAAAKDGAKVFLIPKGQRVVYVQESKEVRKGPFIFVTSETKPVDLVELGNKLGVKVYEVETVQEALAFYTGYRLERPEVTINLVKYSDLLKLLADRMKKDTLDLYNQVKPYSEQLSDAEELMKRAEEEYTKGNYYTSTSLYFQAKIKMRYVQYLNTIDENNVEGAFEDVEKEINAMKSQLSSIKSLGIETIQIVGAAQERVSEAEKHLENARRARNFDDAMFSLAFAKERVESAKVWMSLLKTVEEDVPIDEEALKKRTQFYMTQADTLIVYANSIGGYRDLISEATDSLEMSKVQFEEGFYAGSAFSAIDAITKAALSIELIGYEKDIETKVNSARDAANAALSEAESVITPVLPIAYYEYAENIKEPLPRLSFYKLSERLSKLIVALSSVNTSVKLTKVDFSALATPTVEEKKIEKEIPGLREVAREVIKEIPGFEVVSALMAVTVVLALSAKGYVRRR